MLRRLPLPDKPTIPDLSTTDDLLDRRSRERAIRSMQCLPFSVHLFRDLQQQGLDATALWGDRLRYGRADRWYRHPENLERDLLWLIAVGVLRREVDGQGLTSRFRLTPLGRDLLDHDRALLDHSATLGDQIRFHIRRLISH